MPHEGRRGRGRSVAGSRYRVERLRCRCRSHRPALRRRSLGRARRGSRSRASPLERPRFAAKRSRSDSLPSASTSSSRETSRSQAAPSAVESAICSSVLGARGESATSRGAHGSAGCRNGGRRPERSVVGGPSGAEQQARHLPLSSLRQAPSGAERAHADRPRRETRQDGGTPTPSASSPHAERADCQAVMSGEQPNHADRGSSHAFVDVTRSTGGGRCRAGQRRSQDGPQAFATSTGGRAGWWSPTRRVGGLRQRRMNEGQRGSGSGRSQTWSTGKWPSPGPSDRMSTMRAPVALWTLRVSPGSKEKSNPGPASTA